MTSGSALIAAGIVITAFVLLPDTPVLVAAAGWIVAGLGMGLAYSMLALVMLETAEPGQEGSAHRRSSSCSPSAPPSGPASVGLSWP